MSPFDEPLMHEPETPMGPIDEPVSEREQAEVAYREQLDGDSTSTKGSAAEIVIDFLCLASRSTHAVRYTDGRVGIFKGRECVIVLYGKPAADYLDWQDKQIASMQGMPIPGRF